MSLFGNLFNKAETPEIKGLQVGYVKNVPLSIKETILHIIESPVVITPVAALILVIVVQQLLNGPLYSLVYAVKPTGTQFTPPLTSNSSALVNSSLQSPLDSDNSTTDESAGVVAVADTIVIQAEDYDVGGQKSSYYDATEGNLGAEYRNDDVDVASIEDGSGYAVGWMDGKEWLSYSFSTTKKSSYNLKIRGARYLWQGDVNAKFHIEIDGNRVFRSYNMPDTGSFEDWVVLDLAEVELDEGDHVLVFKMHKNGNRVSLMNLDWLMLEAIPDDVELPEGDDPAPPTDNIQPSDNEQPQEDETDNPVARTVTVQAEDYITGGQGVAYNDITPGNDGGEYRSGGVDIELTEDIGGGYNIGYTHGNEWIKYNLDVAATGNYAISIRLARNLWEGDTPADFYLEIDGKNVTGVISAPGTGGWQEWITLDAGVVTLSQGEHELRYVIDANEERWGLMNINWFKFTPTDADTSPAPVTPTSPSQDDTPPTPPPQDDTPPTPPPVPPPSTSSKQESGQIRINGGSNVVIEDLSFEDLGYNVPAIILENVSGATIRNNDFYRVAEAIYILDSSGPIVIENNYAEDILGPYTRDGTPRGNFVQLDKVWGEMSIAYNTIDGGDFEDVISLYSSGGNSNSEPLWVHHNRIRGCRPDGLCWRSDSGSAVMSGDAGGAYVLVEKNIMVNPGQVGVGIASGSNITVRDNVIYQEQTSRSNVGIYVWNQYPDFCGSHNITGNRVNYTNAGGGNNGFWNGNNCSNVNVSGNNWSDSSINASIWDMSFSQLGL